MTRPGPTPVTLAAVAALALAACGGGGRALRKSPDETELRARVAARGATFLGQGRERFTVGQETFNADCAGYVEAVYAAEGIPLRRILRAAAPKESSAVVMAWEASARYGERWRDRGRRPEPGDLVFFDQTWDRDRDGKRDDPLTHVGLVEWVNTDGTVTFLHRGGSGVVRAVMNLDRPDKARDQAGRPLNSQIRSKVRPGDQTPVLAGQLFAGFGRIDVGRAPR